MTGCVSLLMEKKQWQKGNKIKTTGKVKYMEIEIFKDVLLYVGFHYKNYLAGQCSLCPQH